MPLDQFMDAVYALSEAHTFDVFCRELGWSGSRYSSWLVSEIHHLVATPPFDERPGVRHE